MTKQDNSAEWHLSVAALPKGRATEFSVRGTAAVAGDIAAGLGLLKLDKLRLSGRIEPVGKADWRLRGELGATVTQSCVVTLEPVTTRIDEPVERLFLAAGLPEPEGGETEVPEDDSVEALGDTIDLLAVATEALALALPPYPRADGATLEDAQFTEPGQTPMTDDDAKPFAGLKALKDQLSQKPE